ncbi:flagellar basal-body rod protein FlgG [Porticoccaceae bacterium LTM1]|nr:flagellar basal-body rod protein FlgG [Porticoccaceae bacterium LTM1]
MNQALWISKTGLDAQQTKMAAISNNLANAGTTAYKRSRAVFEEMLYQNLRQVGAQTSQETVLPSGLMLGTGVRVVATEKMFAQGNLTQTQKPLDIAIEGRGFLQVTMPDGTLAYTRDGSLQMDASGQIVTASGFGLQPTLIVPANSKSVTVGADGTVSVVTEDNQSTQIGTLTLADFVNPAGLQPMGQNLYVESISSGTPQVGNPGANGMGTLAQGFLEGSNVNVVEELVSMIETQRAYEMNSKAISTADQMLQNLTQQL